MDDRLRGCFERVRARLVKAISDLDKDLDYVERLKLKSKNTNKHITKDESLLN